MQGQTMDGALRMDINGGQARGERRASNKGIIIAVWPRARTLRNGREPRRAREVKRDRCMHGT